MSLVCVGVTLGTPNAAGEVPITVSNLAAEIAQAVTDLGTLSSGVETVQTDVGTVASDITSAQGAVTTANTALGTAQTAVTNAASSLSTYLGGVSNVILSLINCFDTNPSYNFVTLFPGFTYNSTTKLLGGSTSSSVTLTTEQVFGILDELQDVTIACPALGGFSLTDVTTAGNYTASLAGGSITYTSNGFGGIVGYSGTPTITTAQAAQFQTYWNQVMTDLLSYQTTVNAVSLSGAESDITTAVSDVGAAITSLASAATAAASAQTAASGISTSTVAGDLTAAQAIISSANVYVQTDSSVTTNVAGLNGALVATLTFVRDNNILPT